MSDFVKEFKAFIATGNLIEIAVGLILALKVKDVIDLFMAGVVEPIIGAIFGKPNFDDVLKFTINDSTVRPGLVLTALVNLVLVGLVLFLVIRWYNAMRAKRAVEEGPAAPTEVELLTEIRDSLRQRG